MRTVDVTVSAQNTAWSTPVPNGLKNYVKDVQIVHFCDNATMTRLVKRKFCQLSRNASESLVSQRAALVVVQTRCADVKHALREFLVSNAVFKWLI